MNETIKKEKKQKEGTRFIKIGELMTRYIGSMQGMNKVIVELIDKLKEDTGLLKTGVSYNYLDTFKINDISFLLNDIHRDLEHLKRVVNRKYE